jgi:uncharacterized protein with ATP-grasp and redox domains
MAGADKTRQEVVMSAVRRELSVFDWTRPPPELAHRIHQIIKRETNSDDPYREAKRHSTHEALALYPELKRIVANADDPLSAALRLSVAGNIIDFGTARTYDLKNAIERSVSEPFAINSLESFRQALSTRPNVLFLGDNAGETVFDRVLIETLVCPVTYVVKAAPILNDATLEDALAAGLNDVSTVVDNGSSALGTVLGLCSPDFLRHFSSADLIIAKGQANYETLSYIKRPIYFLLQAKCPVVARHLGVPCPSFVVGKSRNRWVYPARDDRKRRETRRNRVDAGLRFSSKGSFYD